jgi:hypothetical protein
MNKMLLTLFIALLALPSKAQTIPNADFENWSIVSFDQPDQWVTYNNYTAPVYPVTKVTGFTNDAIRLETKLWNSNPTQGYVANTQGDVTNFEGGIPYVYQPAALTGYYKYSIMTGDTAYIGVIFKNSGTPISVNYFTITGSQSTFTSFNFPIPAMGMNPDTMIMFASSSTYFGTGIAVGSFLEIDQLAFTGPGTPQTIPNGSFDSWSAISNDVPGGWAVLSSGGVSKTTSKYTGTYAALLETYDDGTGTIQPGMIASGSLTGGGIPGIPFTDTADTLTGYYKYLAAFDVGYVTALVYKNGNPINTAGYFPFAPTMNYTYFEIPLNVSSIPDTLSIFISASGSSVTPLGSQLYIDNLKLKTPVGIKELPMSRVNFVYPNPVTDRLVIKLGKDKTQKLTVSVYNAAGELQFTKAYKQPGNEVSVITGDLPAGLYFYEINEDGNKIKDRFIKR